MREIYWDIHDNYWDIHDYGMISWDNMGNYVWNIHENCWILLEKKKMGSWGKFCAEIV